MGRTDADVRDVGGFDEEPFHFLFAAEKHKGRPRPRQRLGLAIFTVGDEGAVRSTCPWGGEEEERWKFGQQQ